MDTMPRRSLTEGKFDEAIMSRDYDRECDRDYDDREDVERDSDRYPRREKSSSNSLLLILGGIGCAVLLGCGGLIALGIWGISKVATEITPATEAANQFLDHLQKNQIDRAYDLTSRDFRGHTTKEQFADYVKRFEMFGKHTSREASSTYIFKNQNGTQATIKMTLKSPNNAMTCTVVLVPEQDSWKVNSLNVP
jgi:hypothetical protein